MIEIGGNKFEVPEPDGIDSFVFQQRLIPVVGRMAGIFLNILELDPRSDLSALLGVDVMKLLPIALPGLGRVIAEMPPGEFKVIQETLLDKATCDAMPLFQKGKPGGGAYGAVMRGRTMDGWKLLWYALQVWYPDVFTLGQGWTGRAGTPGSSSAASTTSTASVPATASSNAAG